MNWGYNYLQITPSLLSIKTGEPSILILLRFKQKASARIWGRRSNMHPWNPGYLIELCQPLSNKESAWQGSPHFFVKGKETSFQNQGTHNTTWWKQFDVLVVCRSLLQSTRCVTRRITASCDRYWLLWMHIILLIYISWTFTPRKRTSNSIICTLFTQVDGVLIEPLSPEASLRRDQFTRRKNADEVAAFQQLRSHSRRSLAIAQCNEAAPAIV